MATKSSKSSAPAATSDNPHAQLSPEKQKALAAALGHIEKQFGKGAIMHMNERSIEKVPVFSTGSLMVDHALGIGGLPRGRIIEIYGPESSGKTTMALHAVAECQKAGGVAAFVDAEHALDPAYAQKLGVNLDALLISQPDTGEQALEIVDTLVNSGAVDMIVVDSVAALTPKAEIEGEMGDHHVGLHARLMSQAMRKIAGNIKRTNSMVIFINQIRMKIGMNMPGVSPETTTGGNALKFYASIRMDIRRIGSVKVGEVAVGNEVRVRVIKNKMAPPFRQALTQIIFGQGFSRSAELLEVGVKESILEKSGAWLSFDGNKLGNGKEQCRAYLDENPDIGDAILARIRAIWDGTPLEVGSPHHDDDLEGQDRVPDES
jgi:recombination protein RecA